MGKFSIQMTGSAAGDIENIPDKTQLISAIGKLGDNPLPTGADIKKLKGFNPPLYRLRSGDYRALYRVAGPLVTVMRVINRKDLEKIIKQIK